MNILITGAAGFLGSSLVKQLAKNEIVSQVTAYDNLSNGSFDYMFLPFEGKSKVTVVVGDILDSRTLAKAVRSADYVVHAASVKLTADMHTFDQVNCWGTAEVVAAFEQSNAKGFALISDVSVFGDISQAGELLPNPMTPYANSVLRAEAHVHRLVTQKKAVIIRTGEYVGISPVKVSTTDINGMVFKALSGCKVDVFGNGNLLRNITNIDSVTLALEAFFVGSLAAGTYSAIDYSISSMQVVDSLRDVFPELEVVFISHHYEGEGIAIPRSVELPELEADFTDSIKKIKEAYQ